ncbi:hypothetical protein [Vagococcus fluvialis]|uniref:hypothetical protein n=1 Tax=Vagococcus fluvialis TaxID=2738 RepID=UPI001D0A6141|nr:hypothetical protein [Vagococcus fluvialis]UDM81174.1 hypothetical protein K5K97_14055 [Vagococcus fluvialis]
MKKIYFSLLLSLSLIGGASTSLASSSETIEIDPNEIVSSRLDVGLEENESTFKGLNARSTRALTTFNHSPGIHWDRGYRSVSSWTQAKQGKKNISSYSRARFERPWYLGGNYYDTGRKNSPKFGAPSYAKTKAEYYNATSSGKASTYYGI